MLLTIPEMSLGELEKALKHLPEPLYAEVSLYGNFDYSALFQQAQNAMKGAKLKNGGGLVFRLEDPSKENLINIYKKSYELRKNDQKTNGTKIQRRIDLHKAYWYSDNHVKIELTPWEITASYQGQEPKYISQMRQELVGTNVRLRLEVNNALR